MRFAANDQLLLVLLTVELHPQSVLQQHLSGHMHLRLARCSIVQCSAKFTVAFPDGVCYVASAADP